MIFYAYLNLETDFSETVIRNFSTENDYAHAWTFRNEQRQRQSLAGACLARILCAYATDIPPQNWHINRGKDGAPSVSCFSNYLKPNISISHSKEHVVAAITKPEIKLGLDIETLSPRRDIKGILEVQLPEFKDYFPKDRQELYQIWTEFEAYFKTTGELTFPSFPKAMPDGLRYISGGPNLPKTYFKSFINDDFITTICLHKGE